MLTVTPIKAFSDNYIWCIREAEGDRACVVDPGDGEAVLRALQASALELAGILITHHHFDHTGGLDTLLAHRKVPVYGPRNPLISQITDRVGEGDRISVLGSEFEVIEVPGHTLDHIAYLCRDPEPLLFCGDTLFAGGCGRLFEGDPATMYRSLGKLAHLGAATRVYCAHEYTLANLAFAAAVEPDNLALQERIRADTERRERDIPTVPSTIGLELATNPFLRALEPTVAAHLQHRDGVDPADPVAVFAATRHWKDNF
jgi:hydroxyacylglutathione hydrolase